MKVIEYEETMKCLDEVEDCEDKTYAKSLLEWAINKRTFEAIPLSVIEKITTEIQKKIDENLDSEGIPNEYAYCYESVLDIIDKEVKEIEQ